MADQVQMTIIAVVCICGALFSTLTQKQKNGGLQPLVTESLSFILIYGLVFSIFIKGLDRCVVEKLDDGIPME